MTLAMVEKSGYLPVDLSPVAPYHCYGVLFLNPAFVKV